MIQIDEVVCWSDSLVTLYWIKGTSEEFKKFVENRVAEVRKHTETDIWRHVPGILNPSDIPRKGSMLKNLYPQLIWRTLLIQRDSVPSTNCYA